MTNKPYTYIAYLVEQNSTRPTASFTFTDSDELGKQMATQNLTESNLSLVVNVSANAPHLQHLQDLKQENDNHIYVSVMPTGRLDDIELEYQADLKKLGGLNSTENSAKYSTNVIKHQIEAIHAYRNVVYQRRFLKALSEVDKEIKDFLASGGTLQ